MYQVYNYTFKPKRLDILKIRHKQQVQIRYGTSVKKTFKTYDFCLHEFKHFKRV